MDESCLDPSGLGWGQLNTLCRRVKGLRVPQNWGSFRTRPRNINISNIFCSITIVSQLISYLNITAYKGLTNSGGASFSAFPELWFFFIEDIPMC